MPDDAWNDDPLVDAWSALLRLHARLLPTIDRAVHASTGLPLAWYDVLLELNAAPGRRMRMFDLGESVVLSRSRVSRLVDELVAQGLVTRVANPDDRRSAFAQITSEGRTALRRAAPHYLASIREHLGRGLTQAEARLLARLLEQVIDKAD